MKSISRKSVWLILGLLLFSIQAKAQDKTFDETILSEKGRQSYQTLLRMDLFAIGGIGETGYISEGEKALEILMQEKESIPAMKSLIGNSSPEGGLYALVGLKTLGCDCFEEEFATYSQLPEPPLREKNEHEKLKKGNVSRRRGCFIFQESRLKVADDIKTGKFN